MGFLDYAAAVERMRQLGLGPVVERDWPGREPDPPYRRAHLDVRTDCAGAPEMARLLAEAAVEIGGHMTLYVRRDKVMIDLAISRTLTKEEAAGLEPGKPREVAS